MTLTSSTIRGTYTAIVTPFSSDGSAVDEDSLANLIDFQVAAGVSGLIACGSCGEAATLSMEEYIAVARFVKARLKGRIPCIVGLNSSSTARAVEMAKAVSEVQADGLLVVAPPYNKPPQEGLYRHFLSVRNAASLPIIAYNIPGRTSINIHPSTIVRLAKQGVIAGLKESSGSLDQVVDILSQSGDSLAVLSGEDSLACSIMACGGKGLVSTTANLTPDPFVELTAAALRGDFETARRVQLSMIPLIRAIFLETNPIPLKSALFVKHIIKTPAVRLPLVTAQPETVDKIQSVLQSV